MDVDIEGLEAIRIPSNIQGSYTRYVAIGLASTPPPAIGPTSQTGTSSYAARADHTHAAGSLNTQEGNATNGSMILMTLSQPGIAALDIFYNGLLLTPGTDYNFTSQQVIATTALNVAYGGTGSDGLGFSNTDQIVAIFQDTSGGTLPPGGTNGQFVTNNGSPGQGAWYTLVPSGISGLTNNEFIVGTGTTPVAKTYQQVQSILNVSIISFGSFIETPSPKTIPLILKMVCPYTLTDIWAETSTGFLNVTINVNGTPVVGLTNISVTNTTTNTAISGLVGSAGDTLSFTISNLANTPANFNLQVDCTRG